MPAPVTAQYMRDWGKHTHGSPLYAGLVEVVADDPELMRVINRIEHLPPPNLLFAAVQYLLMEGADDDLARFYPSIVPAPEPPETVGPPFRRFVLQHEERIVEIGNTRYTQTNECRRCVSLLPMMMMAPFDSFHLVDVGASAGLNLANDHYGYRYDGLQWHPEAGLVLQAEWRGEPVPFHEIEILGRTGLDLNPLDPSDEGACRWLDALIWPEHGERRARLRCALQLVAALDIDMIAGDAILTLPHVLEAIAPGVPVVLMSSFTLGQFDRARRQAFDEIVAGAREDRPVFRMSMDVLEKSDDWAQLVVDDGGGPRIVGQAHPHGEWVEIYLRPGRRPGSRLR
jgi:hypothetical protein